MPATNNDRLTASLFVLLCISFISFTGRDVRNKDLVTNRSIPGNLAKGTYGFADTTIDPNGQNAGSTVASQSELQLISNQFSFTEGPAVDRHGNIFFTDQPNDKIWKYSTGGKLSVFLDHAGRPNGMHFDKKGNLLACADEKNQLWSITPAKKISVLLKDYQGHLLNGPNDLWVDPKGGIYLTDPYYQRPYWERKASEMAGENVYYLPPGKKDLLIVADGLLRPNGIVGTPDGKYLFVADIKGNKTYKYSINKNGSLSGRTLFAELGSDGMTLDSKGNLYLTGNGITVYDSKGEKIDHIKIPSKWTTNVCFGGKDRKDLFITASESVYLLRMKVKGVE